MFQRKKDHHYTVISGQEMKQIYNRCEKLFSPDAPEFERAEADRWAEENHITPIISKQHPHEKLFLRMGVQLATLVFLLLTSVGYMDSMEVHSAPVGIFEYTTMQGDDMLVVTIGEATVPADWHGVYVPTIIWEGFELVEEEIERLGHRLRYENRETGEYIVLLQYSQNMTINMFTEGKVEYVMIQDKYMANVYVQNGTVNINWKINDVTILLTGNITKEELIEFANHIEWRD
jgi:predicted small integral membrane protein